MQVINDIRLWAQARGITQNSTVHAQFVKLAEEFGELANAIAKNKDDEFVDAIGDMFVVLTILAAQKGKLIENCIGSAYSVIKDRKGYMTPEGIFIKEE